MEYLLVCRSLTHAKRILGCLSAAGIPATMRRTPEYAAREGCSYSVCFDENWNIKAFKELKANRLEPHRVLLYSDGKAIRVM